MLQIKRHALARSLMITQSDISAAEEFRPRSFLAVNKPKRKHSRDQRRLPNHAKQTTDAADRLHL